MAQNSNESGERSGALLYSDPLVDVTDRQIRIKCYYMWGGDKRIDWTDVSRIVALTPSLWNGKWRLWGTGGFRTWFACDFDRPVRQTIFQVILRTQRVRVGFTVHDAVRFREAIASRDVLDDRQQSPIPQPMQPPPAKPFWRTPVLYVLLFLVCVIFGDAAYYYPKLPQTVATHFGASGQADGWASKQALVAACVAVSVFIAALFLMIALAVRRTAASRIGNYTLLLPLATLLLIAGIAHLTYLANLTANPSLGTAPWWLVGGFLGFVVLWLIGLFRQLA